MATLEQIEDFLAHKRFAMVGISRQPQDISRSLFREFLSRGYDAVPVNPDAREIDGHTCFAHLKEIQPPAEDVLLMTSPAVTEEVVRECADTGVKRVWMFRGGGQGAVSSEAVRFCETHKISVIPGECPFMFFPKTSWFHRLHGFIRKIAHSYPQ